MTPAPAARAAACVAAALLAGCAAPPLTGNPPRSYVVLLPQEDGGTGTVIYAGQNGTVTLNQRHQATALEGLAQPYPVDTEQLRRDARAAIDAQPSPPRTFILHFDVNALEIDPASRALLPLIAREVHSRVAPDVSVTGHTDTSGSAEANAELALKRAQAVAALLQPMLGTQVPLDISSHGETNLLVPTADGVGEPRNRRVEVTVR